MRKTLKYQQLFKTTSASRPYDPAKHLNRLFYWAISAMIIFCSALIINYYRKPLLGFEPAHLNDNVAFNLSIFIPLTLTSVLISYFAAGHVFIGWRKMKNLKLKILVLLFTLPILILSGYQFFNVLRV